MTQHTERFTNRVETYIRSRPGYPHAIVDLMKKDCGLLPSWTVADIGSGTGLLSEIFLKNGNPVLGVEPNAEMREASERLMRAYPKFKTLGGSAEETQVPNAGAKVIVAGQSFHWFDQAKARKEFERILQPGGYVALIWNTRTTEASAFGRAYEEVVRKYGTNYVELRHENLTDETIAEFFGPKGCSKKTFPNNQHPDREGFKGRIASMSWVPLPADPRYSDMMRDLDSVFDKYQEGGRVPFEYLCEVHYGQFS